MEDHFAGSSDAHGGPTSNHALDVAGAAVGAGDEFCAATKGTASALRNASVKCIFFFFSQEALICRIGKVGEGSCVIDCLRFLV